MTTDRSKLAVMEKPYVACGRAAGRFRLKDQLTLRLEWRPDGVYAALGPAAPFQAIAAVLGRLTADSDSTVRVVRGDRMLRPTERGAALVHWLGRVSIPQLVRVDLDESSIVWRAPTRSHSGETEVLTGDWAEAETLLEALSGAELPNLANLALKLR